MPFNRVLLRAKATAVDKVTLKQTVQQLARLVMRLASRR